MSNRFKYTAPHNDWGKDKRWTVQQAFQWGIKREPRPTHASRLEFLRHDMMLWRAGRKPNRLTIGTIRAFGATNFFRGCYQGAEND